jgi:hypothetical protein
MAHLTLGPRGSSGSVESGNSVGSMSNGLDGNMLDTLRALEGGSRFTRFYLRKRPENRMFSVKLETRQIVWVRNIGGKPEGVGQ